MTTLRCRVLLLDDTITEWDLEKKAVGQVLFDKVCEYLNLLERDYFGLAAWDSSKCKVWLDLSKQVQKQIKSLDATFTFSVKFYPPDPSEVAEDITRYLLCLELREDILTSRLPCPSDMLAVLGSYMIQSDYGDHNPELHGKEIIRNIPFAPNQNPELEEEVIELHRSLKSMSPAEADQLFLQNIKSLDMYGVHLHAAKDESGEDVMLGVCADGLMVYKDEEKTMCFVWPSILNMSYRRSNFQARTAHTEDTSENTIKFSLPSYRACKCLWKNAVEHHAFFRNHKTVPEGLLHFGSRFHFQGLTHAESLEASANIKRPAPLFSRSALKRKAKESFIMSLKRPSRPESDDWFQVLGSDKPWPTYNTDKEEPSGGDAQAYKGEDGLSNEWLGSKVDGPDNEWFRLLGGRHLASFPTQQSLPTLSSDSDILESAKLQLWKLQADDWFVLLEPRTYQLPDLWLLKTRPVALQSSQTEQHGEELEWAERTSETNKTFVKERKEFVSDQNEEIVLEEGGEKIYTKVMYERRTQLIETYTGQSQEASVGQRMRGIEEVNVVHELMLKTGQVTSETNIDELKETLIKVETIEQKLHDIERLKIKLKEVVMLERRQLQESDDWYILLEHKRVELSTPAKRLRVGSFEQTTPNPKWKRQERGERDDWYLLLDRKPSTVSSASAEIDIQSSWTHVVEEHKNLGEIKEEEKATHVQEKDSIPITISAFLQTQGHSMDTAEEKVEIRPWMETELQKVNTVMPVEMKDDWHTLLELLPQASKTMKLPLLPSEPVTPISEDADAGLRPRRTVTIKEEEVEKKSTIIRETHVIVGGDERKNPATVREDEDDWFVLFTPEQIEKKIIVTDVYKETWQEEVQLVEKRVKMRAYNEERMETLETTHEMILPAATRPQQTITIREKAVIITETHVTAGKEEWTNPVTRRDGEDNWFVLFTPVKVEKKVISTEPVTPISEDADAGLRPRRTVTIKEEEVEKMPTIIRETHVIVGGDERKNPATVREDEDDWFVLFTPEQIEKKIIVTVPMTPISEDVAKPIPQRLTIKEKGVMFEQKPTIIKEKQVIIEEVGKKIPVTKREVEDIWYGLFTPVPIEKKLIVTAGVSDTWTLEENRLREVQKQRLGEDARRRHVVEDRRLPPYVPEAKAGGRHREVIDDWFLLLEPFSKTSVSEDRRAEEDRRRKEELIKKQPLAEDRRKVAVDQPMTSTPTAQSVHAYKDKRLKRLDITQEIAQNIKQESKEETEATVKRKRRDKRIDGESIYIRHSILMLEDSDVTQEVLLRHHASVSELKRIFMEDMPVSGPTEWDRRLSSYTPVVYPILSNGDLFTDIMKADGLVAM